VTFEASVAFIAFFLFCWGVMGLVTWAIAAVIVRGRGAIIALPLALAAACAAGILVPVLGQRDLNGYFLSLGMALVGGAIGCAAGIAFSRRVNLTHPTPARPTVPHTIGSSRPAPSPETPEPQPPSASH
jgi:hypothetical protein